MRKEWQMSKYTELDKDLKQIRNNGSYDLYKINLESQKKIDEFYKDEIIPENDMMIRKYKLDSYITKKNILIYPIIITVVFGVLVSVITNFNVVKELPKVFAELRSVSVEGANRNDLIILYSMVFLLLFLFAATCAVLLFSPFPPLCSSIDMLKNREQQVEYELKILNEMIDKKIEEYKNGKEYPSHVKKHSTKQMLLIIGSLIAMFWIGNIYGLSCDKIMFLTFIGAVAGYNVSSGQGNEK